MPFQGYYLSPEGELRLNISQDEVKTAFASGEGLLWVDFFETTAEDGAFMEQALKFHHLAVEDCVSPLIHPPKMDDFGEYIFIIVHGINHAVETELVETAELALFLSTNFVVTNHNFHLYSTQSIKQLVEDDGRPMKRGADFLAHALIDALVDNVLPTIDKMSDVAEEIEEEVVNNPHQGTLESILKLKRSTLRVHRVMAPQRDVLNRLSRGECRQIRDETQIFYRDIFDHIVRIEDLNQTIRDRAANALSTYLSSVANRQNDVMKLLSTVATIFLPLSLLAGIYGMNFEYMPELSWRWGYFAVLSVMGAAVISLVWWFWARQWISLGRRRITRLKIFTVEPNKLVHFISHRPKVTRQRRNLSINLK